MQFIDADDNGDEVVRSLIKDTKVLSVSDLVSDFNPSYLGDDAGQFDDNFERAVSFADGILERMIAQARYEIATRELVAEILAKNTDKRFAILKRPISMKGLSSHFPDLLYIIFPEPINQHYFVYALRKRDEEFASRKPFPESWAGLRSGEMARVSGVADATFCHKMRFLVVAKSLDGAKQLVYKALEN